MRKLKVSLDLLESFVDNEQCWFDHHGGCQAHGYLSLQPGEMCPQHELKEIIAKHHEKEEKKNDKAAE
jgi:hypothetical protein